MRNHPADGIGGVHPAEIDRLAERGDRKKDRDANRGGDPDDHCRVERVGFVKRAEADEAKEGHAEQAEPGQLFLRRIFIDLNHGP